MFPHAIFHRRGVAYDIDRAKNLYTVSLTFSIATSSTYQTTEYPPVIRFQIRPGNATGFESQDDGYNSGHCENDIWYNDRGSSVVA